MLLQIQAGVSAARSLNCSNQVLQSSHRLRHMVRECQISAESAECALVTGCSVMQHKAVSLVLPVFSGVRACCRHNCPPFRKASQALAEGRLPMPVLMLYADSDTALGTQLVKVGNSSHDSAA